MNASEYVEAVRNRLVADGCEVRHERIGPVPALVGYRADFLPQLMSRLHVLTVVASVERADGQVVRDLARQAGQYGKDRKGALRGLQSGVAVFAVLVSNDVTADAVAAAEEAPRVQFAVRVQPVLVNLGAGVVHTCRRRQIWGFMMNGHLRRKLDHYFPKAARTSGDR